MHFVHAAGPAQFQIDLVQLKQVFSSSQALTKFNIHVTETTQSYFYLNLLQIRATFSIAKGLSIVLDDI